MCLLGPRGQRCAAVAGGPLRVCTWPPRLAANPRPRVGQRRRRKGAISGVDRPGFDDRCACRSSVRSSWCPRHAAARGTSRGSSATAVGRRAARARRKGPGIVHDARSTFRGPIPVSQVLFAKLVVRAGSAYASKTPWQVRTCRLSRSPYRRRRTPSSRHAGAAAHSSMR